MNTTKNKGAKALLSVLLAGGMTVAGGAAATALDLDLDLDLLGEDGILSDTGILNGTDLLADLGVPVTIENNSIGVIGDSSTGSTAPTEQAPAEPNEPAPTSDGSIVSVTSDRGTVQITLLDGLLNNAPTGAIVAGDLATVWLGPGQLAIIDLNLGTIDGLGVGDVGVGGVGDLGVGDIVTGSDIDAGVAVPVTVENNAVSVIGDSSTGGTGTAPAENGSIVAGLLSGVSLGADGDGLLSDGILNGIDLAADATVPVNVSCNSISVIGSSTSGCAAAADDPGDPGDPGDPSDPGDPGEAGTPGASGGGLAGTGAEGVGGMIGIGALALIAGVAATLIGRRFGVSA